MRHSKNIHFLIGLASANIGLIRNDDEVALIDAGWTEESVAHLLWYLELIRVKRIKYLFLSHGDYDHIGGARQIRRTYGAEIVVHEDEVEKLKRPTPPIMPISWDIALNREEDFHVGNLRLKVIPTPGHCSGSVCVYLKEDKALFAGDMIVSRNFNIFCREGWKSYSYVRLPLFKLEDMSVFLESLMKIRKLELKWILPGHGCPILDPIEHIDQTLDMTKKIMATSLDFFKERHTSTELAEILEVNPLFAKEVTLRLESERRIERIDEETVIKEPIYLQKSKILGE